MGPAMLQLVSVGKNMTLGALKRRLISPRTATKPRWEAGEPPPSTMEVHPPSPTHHRPKLFATLSPDEHEAHAVGDDTADYADDFEDDVVEEQPVDEATDEAADEAAQDATEIVEGAACVAAPVIQAAETAAVVPAGEAEAVPAEEAVEVPVEVPVEEAVDVPMMIERAPSVEEDIPAGAQDAHDETYADDFEELDDDLLLSAPSSPARREMCLQQSDEQPQRPPPSEQDAAEEQLRAAAAELELARAAAGPPWLVIQWDEME
eukprot:2450736-Prymnesium_polylepis.1